MSDVRTTCPYCGVGCGLTARRAGVGDRWTIAGDKDHPANFGRLCSKGAALGETLEVEGRLLHPEIGGRRASWDAALDTVARGFSEIVAAHGPDAVAFYVSGQMLTEDYYVANKLMKGFIGSANIDTNSRLCMASAVAGHKRAFGTDTVPVSYEDLERAELIVIVGSNMAWCHPVLFQRIVQAKSANTSLRVVVVDPRRTATCDAADLFLPIRPGTDVMLFNGLLNHLRREDALDWPFLDAHTEGVGAAMQTAKESSGSIPVVALACGVTEASVAQFYEWFTGTPRAITVFSQGVNQSSSGTDKVNSIINVHLATGRIGKPGAGPFSVTGQPNAMGGREVGGLANQLAAHMEFASDDLERVQRFWNASRVARRPGLKAVDLFEAVGSGRVKAVWIMCTNPVVSMPDADSVERALRGCDFVVVSECMRRTDTTACADILLPAATWGEKSGTVTNSERRISRQRAFLTLPGESRPDWWIVTQVARRMGFAAAFPFESPAQIFREHARLSAYENDGKRAFDIGALAALSDEDYDCMQPTRWPAVAPAARGLASAGHRQAPAAHDPDGAGGLGDGVRPAGDSRDRLDEADVFSDGRFFTGNGKARFVPTSPRAPKALPDERHPLILNTGRVRDQWHTMTRTGASARLSGHRPEPFVQVHPVDAERYGVANADLAQLVSGAARVLVRVEVTDEVQAGQVFVPMHWSRQFASDARIGALIPAVTDPVSGQPELKCAVARIEPFRPAWHGFVLSRRPLAIEECAYLVQSMGMGFRRYELAGEVVPPSLPAWARDVVGTAGDWIELSDPAAGRYRAALVENERLSACVFVASAAALPERAWLARLFDDDRLSASARSSILAGRPVEGRADAGPVICSCYSLGRATLIEAIRSQRLVSTDDIGRALRAGTNCGSCLPELKSLLRGKWGHS